SAPAPAPPSGASRASSRSVRPRPHRPACPPPPLGRTRPGRQNSPCRRPGCPLPFVAPPTHLVAWADGRLTARNALRSLSPGRSGEGRSMNEYIVSEQHGAVSKLRLNRPHIL